MQAEPSTGAEAPERKRLRLLAVLGMALFLCGSRAQCSLMTGDDDDDDDDGDDENGGTAT
jgi:hypothetical protein